MFTRNILTELEKWALKKDRKPLVLRGARQVGKTTVINQFSQFFDEYIYLNLELTEDKRPFLRFENIEKLIETIFFLKNKSYSKKTKTLLFIDEIQNVPEALNTLRYFYEKTPELYVISAGSLLESAMNNKITFPVGRVEYLVLRPASFTEYLIALNEKTVLEQIENIPLKKFAHTKILNLFHTYAIIGGMPEIVSNYSMNRDLYSLSSIYESLIISYSDDVEKYAKNSSQVHILRHIINTSFSNAGKRIKYHGFGKSNYGSREISEAMRTLEKAFLINLIFPQTSVSLPLLPDRKKSPRLQLLDTGLLNYFVGIQKEILNSDNLNSVYQGTMIEHLVGQELLSFQNNILTGLNFWVREKKSSTSEVDYLYVFESILIPIEVKSGTEGHLKSLHSFMDLAPHNLAVRLYAGNVNITNPVTTKGKEYYLLNLPYYLVSKIDEYLKWFINEIKKK